jgi:hypothetical protein
MDILLEIPRQRTLIAGGFITKDDFIQWLNTSQPGDCITYFRGYNVGDADESTQETAKQARECFAKGEIELLQSRIRDEDGKPGLLDYLAVKRKNIQVPKVHGAKWLPYIDHNALIYHR